MGEEVSMPQPAASPLPKAKREDKQKLYKFGVALNAVADGRKITKDEWGDDKIYGYLRNDQLVIRKEDGKDYSWILSMGDVTGSDWKIL